MFDEDNGTEWCMGNWLITPEESINYPDKKVFIDYTDACEKVDSMLLEMIYFDPDELTDDTIPCILGECLLTEGEFSRDMGIYRNEYSTWTAHFDEKLVVDAADDILRRMMYGL